MVGLFAFKWPVTLRSLSLSFPEQELFRLGMLELGSDTTRAILELLVTLLQQLDSLPLNDEDRYSATICPEHNHGRKLLWI